MNRIKFSSIAQLAGVSLVAALFSTGCGRFAADNGSLDYRDAKLLTPIQLPEGQAARQIYPLYDVPDKTSKNRLPLTNKKGNRYELPRPSVTEHVSEPTNEQAVTQPRTPAQPVNQSPTAATTNSTGTYYNKALTQTEEGVPVLQVEATPEQTRQKLVNTLGKANYVIVNDGQNQPGRVTISHPDFQGERLLQYRNLGSVTTVVVTQPDSKLAGPQEIIKILSDINTNW